MPPSVVELEVAGHHVGVRLFSSEVWDVKIGEATLADGDEVRTFAVEKRRTEHLSGRWLLEQVLRNFTEVDPSIVMVVRSGHRAPRLAYIHGVWVRTPLPSISIAHSQGRAFVAIGPSDLSIGVDAEPMERTLALNAFDLMAKGDELRQLRKHPGAAIRSWVSKEEVQKSMGLGMHLNPRDVRISIEDKEQEISIENSKIQLSIWSNLGYQMAMASRQNPSMLMTPEDVLLETTLVRMNANPDWGVGCNTQRNAV